MTDADLIAYLESQGYRHIRKLPSGEWAGVLKMLYTTGLYLGLDRYSWRTRFCYETFAEAATALEAWDGKGWPPGYWIKQKPEGTANPNPKVQADGVR